jgi:hypothetical protein
MTALLLLLVSYTYDHHDWLNLPAMDRVVSITTDQFDAYVAVTQGVYVFSKADRKLKRTLTHPDGIRGTIRAVGYDPEFNSLWVLSSGNLLSINPFSDLSFSYELPDGSMNSLGIGRGYVFLARGERYYRLDKRNGQTDTLSPGRQRVAWYGEKSPYDPTNYPFLVPYMYFDGQQRSHPITCVFPDGRRLWVGTEEDGIRLYSLTTRQPLGHWRFGPALSQVERIFALNDGIWFAGEEELTRYEVSRDSWSFFPTPFNVYYPDAALLLSSRILDLDRREPILTLAGDSTDFWIGTEEGLYFYHSRSRALTRQFKFKTRASDILLTADSAFVGTDDGLITYDRNQRTWTLFADTMTQLYFGVYGIAATDQRRYYAVHGGLETQDSLGNWELLTPPGFNLESHPWGLASYGNKLFVGTNSGVLSYSEKTRAYTTLDAQAGLLSNHVLGLYADSSFLWIATDAGISRFDHRALFP